MNTESKRERFQRLAEKRTNEILERLRILGNCSNRGQYEYTPEDIKKIFNVIEKETKLVWSKFKNGEIKQFKLS